MAKTKTAQPQEETKVIRPNDLATELDVDAKRIRAFLRGTFVRSDEAKNTNWELTDEMVSAVREKFTASDEASDES